MFRILQGVAGGGLISTSQAILVETWPREQIGTATALFGLGAVVGPTVGPTIGGYITDHASWNWIFYVNIPVGAIAAFCAYTFIHKTPKDAKGKPIDWWGILLLAIAVGSLQVILEKGESEDWFAKTYILVLTITAILGTILFIWRETTYEFPIVKLQHYAASKLCCGYVYFVYIRLRIVWVGVCVSCVLSKPAWFHSTANRGAIIPRRVMYHCYDALYWQNAQ